MTDDEIRTEIDRLNGRIAALEAVCITVLSQLVSHDSAAKRSIANSLLSTIEEIGVGNEGRRGMTETASKIATNLVRDLD